jgi:alanine-glyoxylate transaminase/serine-glyoxylate transaminase/serine-pyruvate transaminase
MSHTTPDELVSSVLADLRTWAGDPSGGAALWSTPATAAWRRALTTVLSPGDRVLMTRAGEDGRRWAQLASELGLDVVCHDAPAGEGPSLGHLMHLLWWDPSVKAVFVVRDETSTGVASDLAEVRRAIDLTGSSALLLVDGAVLWGVDRAHHEDWGADLLLTSLSAAEDPDGPATLVSWSARWGDPTAGQPPEIPSREMITRVRASLDRWLPPGSATSVRRQHRVAEGVRRGLAALGLQPCPKARLRPSDAVTVAHLPPQIDAARLTRVASARSGARFDLGVGALAGRVLRVWHRGDMDETDCLTTLAAVELCLVAAGLQVREGASVTASREWFGESDSDAA